MILRRFYRKYVIIPEMPDSPGGFQLPEWARTTGDIIAFAWMGIMGKLTHGWAQEAKQSAEFRAELNDHSERIRAMELRIENYHEENKRRSRDMEDRLVAEIRKIRNPFQ
jgi:hypothetical protein